MKKIKLAKTVTMIWAFYFVIGNFYFGWNAKPQSESEIWFDLISKLTTLFVAVMYLSPILMMFEKKVAQNEGEATLLDESMRLTKESHAMIDAYSKMIDEKDLIIYSLKDELKKHQQ